MNVGSQGKARETANIFEANIFEKDTMKPEKKCIREKEKRRKTNR